MINFAKLIVSIAIPLGVGALSGYFSATGTREWYPSLARPPLTPPDWVFGPVWTVLYLMMGIAAFVVWKRDLGTGDVPRALSAFAIQLLFNGLWTVLFFGLRQPALALFEILLLWVSIVLTIRLFTRVSVPAGLLLLPYLLWVSFATYLNFGFWYLNR